MAPKTWLPLLLLLNSALAFAQFADNEILIFDLAAASGMTDVHAVDINQDGRLDILSSSNGYDRLEWMANLGNSRFSEPFIIDDVYYVAELGYVAVQPADFDGDGDLDLAALTRINVLLYTNQGNGNFSDSVSITADINFGEDIHAADLDGDGATDLLTASIYDDKVAWYRNDGSGQFSGQIILSDQMNAARALETADLDGDGDLDVLAASSLDDQLNWFENEGDGQFSAPIPISQEVNGPWAIKAADLDGDGDADLAVGSRYDEMLSWFENTGDGQFPNRHIIENQMEDIEYIQVADLNNDSRPELLLALSESNQIIWYENLGNGNFSSFSTLPSYVGEPVSIDAADMNSDGDMDILYASNQDDIIGWFENFDNAPKISGITYWDANANGQRDPLEIGLYGQRVSLVPDGLASWSDGAGTYQFAVDTGGYVLTCEAAPIWDFTTPEQVEWTIPGGGAVTDFGLVADSAVQQMEIDVSSAPTRCGFTVPFWLNYRNAGNQMATGSISFQLDELATFVNAQPAPDTVNGKKLTWQFDNLPPTYSDRIALQLEMPGVNSLGDSVYFLAQIEWSGEQGDSLFQKAYLYDAQINCAYDPNDKLVTPYFENYPNYTLFRDTLVYTLRFQNTGTDTAFNVLLVDQLDEGLDWSTFELIASSHSQTASLDGRGRLNFRFDNILLPDLNTNEPASHGFVKFRIQARDSLAEMEEITNKTDIFFDFNPPIETNTTHNLMVSLYPVIAEASGPTCFGGEDGAIGVEFPFDQYDFEWSTGQTTSQLDSLPAGVYPISVYDAGGLIARDTFTLSDPIPVLLETYSTPATGSNQDGSATVEVMLTPQPPYTFRWDTEPVQTTPTASGLAPGIYTVTVTDGEGCTSTAEVTVEQLTSTSAPNSDISLKVFPNPSDGEFTLRLEGPSAFEGIFQITDATGRVHRQGAVSNSAGQRVAGLPPGLYYLSLRLPAGVFTRKLMIK